MKQILGFLAISSICIAGIALAANAPTYLNSAGDVVSSLGIFSVEPSKAVTSSSGNVANASAVATLTGAADVTTFISGFRCGGGGATAASLVDLTVAGVIGGTMTFTFGAVAGATAIDVPIEVEFKTPIPATAVNTAIVVTLPALGTGNTKASCAAWGYRY
jgi:hypothetical protein